MEVKRWQNGDKCLRWTAAGMLEAERRCRKITGYTHLDALVLAVERDAAAARHHSPDQPAHQDRAARYARRRRAAAPGRPKGSGTRGAEALALVEEDPGITISEIAGMMGIKQNYLHRVLPALAADGLVVREGRGWKPTDAAQRPTTVAVISRA